MMIKKMFMLGALIQITMVIGFLSTIEGHEIRKKKCTFEDVELAMKTFRGQMTGFEHIYRAININICDIEKEKLRNYLMRFIAELKVDSIYSEEYKKNLSSASFYLKSESGWNRDVEELYSEKMKYYKEKGRMISFYRFAGVLIEKGEKWYDYAIRLVKNSRDDEHCGERRMAYYSLTKRFKKIKNPAEKQKAISIMYALLTKDCCSFDILDKFLSKNVPRYTLSKQRYIAFKGCKEFSDNLPEDSGYNQYLKENLKGKDEKEFRKEYTPPLDLPELSPSE